MVNLDEIQSRFDRGQHLISDVHNLLGEGADVHPDVVARLDRGLRDAGDMHHLYSAVEYLYAKKYSRPTTEQRVAAERKAAADAQVKNMVLRAQVEARKVQLEQEMAAQRATLAQRVAADQLEAVTNKKGKEKAEYEEEAARIAVEFKKKMANDMRTVLEYK